MRNNHGGLEPPMDFTDSCFTINTSFESALTAFNDSISFRDRMTTIDDILQEFNKFTTQLMDKRRHQSQNHSGNKRSKHKAQMRSIPSPRKRNKVHNKHSAEAAQTTTTKKGPSPRSEEYRFIVRNTTFPDPRNCMNFMQNQTEEKSPWFHRPTTKAISFNKHKNEADERATLMKIEIPAPRYFATTLGETLMVDHYQAFRKPPSSRDKTQVPTTSQYREHKHTRFKYITMTMTLSMSTTNKKSKKMTLGATLRKDHYQAFRRPPPIRDKKEPSQPW
jgi:nuclear transport factor 2 (NTF2) superfamily protein